MFAAQPYQPQNPETGISWPSLSSVPPLTKKQQSKVLQQVELQRQQAIQAKLEQDRQEAQRQKELQLEIERKARNDKINEDYRLYQEECKREEARRWASLTPAQQAEELRLKQEYEAQLAAEDAQREREDQFYREHESEIRKHVKTMQQKLLPDNMSLLMPGYDEREELIQSRDAYLLTVDEAIRELVKYSFVTKLKDRINDDYWEDSFLSHCENAMRKSWAQPKKAEPKQVTLDTFFKNRNNKRR